MGRRCAQDLDLDIYRRVILDFQLVVVENSSMPSIVLEQYLVQIVG